MCIFSAHSHTKFRYGSRADLGRAMHAPTTMLLQIPSSNQNLTHSDNKKAVEKNSTAFEFQQKES